MKRLLTCLSVTVLLIAFAARLRAEAQTRTVVVFPFENHSSRPGLSWISEAFAEVISARLVGPACYVLGRVERNTAYEGMGISPGTALTLASEYKAAETLGVNWAVIGDYTVDGQQLTAHAQLLDIQHLKLHPALEASGALEDLVDVETRLAWRLLATEDAGFTTGTEDEFAHRFPQIRLDAFENYIRGILATEGQARVKFLSDADRLEPSSHAAAFALGRFYFEQKDYGNSQKWLRKLESTDSDYLEAMFLIGVDDFFLGQETAAEKAFTTLAAQIPLGEVSNNLGVIEARKGKYAEALPDFERAYKEDPSDADFTFNLGACLFYLKQYDESVKHLEEAIKSSDEDIAAHTLLAAAYAKLGNRDNQQRERKWLTAHEAAPETETADDVLPWTRLKKNYNGHAFALLSLAVHNALEASLAAQPAEKQSGVHLSRGEKFLAASRLPEAEHEFKECLTLTPRDADVHLSLGQVYELQGRHQQAADELENSLRIKNSAPAHIWLARVYVSLNRMADARQHGQLALALDPQNRYARSLIEHIDQRPARRQK